MILIKSNVIPNAYWKIAREIFYTGFGYRALRNSAEILQKENEFVRNFDPVVYCNDLTGAEWCYDAKLPTGGWLENIRVSTAKDGSRIYSAKIIC